ncbi:MAG: response regulator, partial [Maribacter sp.]
MKKYKLIIADDHKMFLDGLLSILSHKEEYDIILTSDSGKNIVKYVDINTDEQIDLIITDINMPEVNGITLNKHIKTNHPKI